MNDKEYIELFNPPLKKKAKKPRWPDYKLVKPPEGIITFGTSLFLRKDGMALRVLFPAGQAVTFAPMDEEKSKLT